MCYDTMRHAMKHWDTYLQHPKESYRAAVHQLVPQLHKPARWSRSILYWPRRPFWFGSWITVGAEGDCASLEEFAALLPKWNEVCKCSLRSILGISENCGGNPAYSITISANLDFVKVDLACIEHMAKLNDRGWMSRKIARSRARSSIYNRCHMASSAFKMHPNFGWYHQ